MKEVTVPLDSIGNYTATFNASAIQNITWTGERITDFNLNTMGSNITFPKQDIQELVPEHLADLHKDEIKISFSKKEITINNTETTWE